MDDNLPVYIISSAADLLGVHPRTLYLYEEEGLLVAVRKGNRRFYSVNDLQWVRGIRYLIHERGLNLKGLGRILALKAELVYRDVPEDLKAQCEDYVGWTSPCWQTGSAHFECTSCLVYVTVRDRIRQDENVPQLPL